jgi:hypothetical protein
MERKINLKSVSEFLIGVRENYRQQMILATFYT